MKDFLKKRSVKFALGGALLGLIFSFSDTKNDIIANLLSGILLGLVVYGIAYLCHYRRKDKENAKLAAAEKAKQEKLAKAQAAKAAKAAEEEQLRAEEIKKPKIYLPQVWQNNVLIYHYGNIPFTPTPAAINIFFDKMQPAKNFELDLQQDDERILVCYDGEKFGEVNGRQDMIKDWLRKKDPLRVHVSEFGTADGSVFLLSVAFYRDEQARWSKKESELVALTNYKKYFKENDDIGISHYGITEGELLSFEEDEESEKTAVYIADTSAHRIGKLPQKQAKRYLAEDASAVFLDHFDYDENDIDIPIVKIYWTNQKED